MKITVIGTGYVGLVTGACLAESGNEVICADIDADKIRMLQEGGVPIYEPGLRELVRRNVQEARLRFTTAIQEAVEQSSTIFIAVGTPMRSDGTADLDPVFQVAKTIAQAMNAYKVIVIKSTVPVGTNERVRLMIAGLTQQKFEVVSNPEFLKEGTAINDFMKPERVIIGTESDRVAELMNELYAPFVRTGKPIFVMRPSSAEMTKYAANAMLANRISFMNELARLCEQTGADVEQVRLGLGSDSRIGAKFLFPGVGFGGSCFPKDLQALIQMGQEHQVPLRILAAVVKVNCEIQEHFLSKIEGHFNGNLAGKRFAVWGLAFKPGTDDMREAPSITIIEALLAQGAEVCAHDPKANGTARHVFQDRIIYHNDGYQALEGADALILITEWNEFRSPDFERVKSIMRCPVVFDGRNLYNPEKIRHLGFTYYGIGRST